MDNKEKKHDKSSKGTSKGNKNQNVTKGKTIYI